jgi:dipeptidyl aminopeptidase/acylaminoacyl peptidase
MKRQTFPLVFITLLVSSVLVFAGQPPAQRRGMTSADFFRLQAVSNPHLSPDGKLVAFVVTVADQKQNRQNSSIWMVPADGSRAPWQLTTVQSSRSPEWRPDGRELAFISARPEPDASATALTPRAQVYVLPLEGGGEARRVTNLKEGVESFSWSRDGTEIACISRTLRGADQGEKRERSDVRHYLHSWYKADGFGYADDRRAQLWVVDARTGNARQITTTDDRHASRPVWSPDGTMIAFVSQRIAVDVEGNMDVLTVAASGGLPRRVSDVEFRIASPRWSPDGTRIAYIAAADEQAIPKLRVSPSIGGQSVVVAGDFTFPTDVDWAPGGKALVAAAGVKGESHLYRVDLETQKVTPVTTGPRAVRQAEIDEKAGLMVYVASDATHPDEVFAADPSGQGERQLTHFNDALLKELELPPVERLSWKSPDGWTVDGFLVKPRGWQADQTSPMVLTIHGGPNGMYGVSFQPDFQILAGAGYAVFFTNPRGSSGYGEKFQRGVANEWGGKAYEDIMSGVDVVLARNPWIDRNRLGVTGQSYGGFMTNWIVSHTDRFRAGVTLSGISDFVSVEGLRDGFYGHSKDFGGDLFHSFDTYWKYSPIRYAASVKTPVLVLHGESDQRVPLSQGEEWFRALKHFGVTSELVIFPREPHSLRREPKHQIELMDWILYWFDRYLNGNQRAVRPDER